MQSSATIGRARLRPIDDADKILTPGDEYNESHSRWKIVAQTKALRERFGWEMVASILAVVISVGGVVAYQSGTNAKTTTAVESLSKSQEQMTKSTAESIGRIEAQVNRSVDLAVQNREDMRSMRENMERRVDKIETLSQSNWNKMVEVSNRMGIVEAKQARQKE